MLAELEMLLNNNFNNVQDQMRASLEFQDLNNML